MTTDAMVLSCGADVMDVQHHQAGQVRIDDLLRKELRFLLREHGTADGLVGAVVVDYLRLLLFRK